jgi:hypothetical protein
LEEEGLSDSKGFERGKKMFTGLEENLIQDKKEIIFQSKRRCKMCK